MRSPTLARGAALAGLAAASATAAHGGGAALADPAWSVPALAAAAAGTAALLRLTAAAGRARAAVARVRSGGQSAAAHHPLGLAEAAAIMLAAQGCAHLALLAAGAPAHPGQTGALALHTALAVLGAALVWAADRTLAGAVEALTAAIDTAVELLLAVCAPARREPPAVPAGRGHAGARHERAPPATA
ncbi:MAG TPA: hypothetical protein VGI72_13625 [Gaiellales bacterium]